MELTHSTRRFLKSAAPIIGSAGMLFAFYQWMVSGRARAVEDMESVQTQEQVHLKNLWDRYDMYHSVYLICDDYLENDMMMTSQMIDTLRERLTDCQSYLRLNKPFIRSDVWNAYHKLLKAHEHFVEVIMWEMCEPEGMDAFLHNSRSDIYEYEAEMIQLLREKLT